MRVYKAMFLADESVTVKIVEGVLGEGDEMPHLTVPVFRSCETTQAPS